MSTIYRSGRYMADCNKTLADMGQDTCEDKTWIGEKCDGADTIYTPHCDMWFMVNHCKVLTEANLTEFIKTAYASDEDAQYLIEMDITEESCRSSRYINAYNQYSGATKKWDDWLAGVTDDADDAADESFTSTAAVGLMLAALAWK
jgi:hypothetical protein